jgi:hypothetical protein
MKKNKEEITELLRIQHALAAAGYYAFTVEKRISSDSIKIEARPFIPGHDESLMVHDAGKAFKTFTVPSQESSDA